ncbi:MAG: trypsin-like peptidase domain-containing protein [Gammaproteobacteria bacterium]
MIYFVVFSVSAKEDNDTRNSVVQIFTESFVPDYLYPWQIDYTESNSGSGVIIKGNRILTAAHVVDNSLSIYVRKTGSDKRYKAKIEYISDASDLVIITVDNNDFYTDTKPLLLGQVSNLGDEVTTWGFPIGGSQLTITKGIISRIDFDRYTHSGLDNLVGQIDAAINSGASGGPAIVDGKLAGITFQLDSSEGASNIGYIIPLSVISQFLKDISDGEVDGVPSITIKTQTMHNPQMRKTYRMKADMSGVLVTKSNFGHEEKQGLIMAGDVLLEIDGLSVGNDGTVPFLTGDRISLNYLFTRKQLGESISIRLLRNGIEQSFNYQLNYNDYQSMLVTRHYSGFIPDYAVIGGLVFQELSRDYIVNTFGEDEYPSWMLILYNDFKENVGIKKDKVVFLATILPDEINIDYEDYIDKRITSVNGTSINNLDELREAIKDNHSDFHIIEFENPLGKIILNKQLAHDKEAEFIDRYNIDSSPNTNI